MKWGTKYGPEYVNRLYGMVRRHLSGDFRFVCLTDRSEGIAPEVQCLPIPPLDLPPGIPERGWTKLTTFAADLHGLQGTALFLDLDVVIVDDITPFFELPGEFLIIHDWKRPWRVTGNSSVYRFRIGAHRRPAEPLSRAGERGACAACRNEQAYLSDCAARAGQAGLLARRAGARAGSTTASRAFRPTTGATRSSRRARASSSSTA